VQLSFMSAKASASKSRARRWTFTLNNYVSLPDPSLWEHCSFCVFQEEVGEARTPHLQGYVEFSTPRTFATIQALDGIGGAHFEVARGTPAQNEAYCSKEEGRIGGPYTFGTISGGQGARNDLVVVRDAIRDGADVALLYEEHFASFIRHEKAFLNYKRHCQAPRNFKTVVFLLVGPPGTGKTRFAHSLMDYLGTKYVVPHPKGSGTYFDGYDGQVSCLIDEMDGNFCTPTFFNQLADRYECTVPVHGAGGCQFVSRYLFITSNYLPKYWWKRHNALASCLRRIDVVFKFIPVVAFRRRTVIFVNGQFIHQ